MEPFKSQIRQDVNNEQISRLSIEQILFANSGGGRMLPTFSQDKNNAHLLIFNPPSKLSTILLSLLSLTMLIMSAQAATQVTQNHHSLHPSSTLYWPQTRQNYNNNNQNIHNSHLQHHQNHQNHNYNYNNNNNNYYNLHQNNFQQHQLHHNPVNNPITNNNIQPILQQDLHQHQRQSLHLHQNQHQNQLITTYPALERCPNGTPFQWRSHMDAPSKAHLAPIVALGYLRHFNLKPIQMVQQNNAASLTAHKEAAQQQQQQILQQASLQTTTTGQPNQALHQLLQNVNNVGIIIEATFVMTSILKRPAFTTTNLNINSQQANKLAQQTSSTTTTTSRLPPVPSEVRLQYHLTSSVQAAASALLMQFANQTSATATTTTTTADSRSTTRALNNNLDFVMSDQLQSDQACSLELNGINSELELTRLFRLHQNYILYLDQSVGPKASVNRINSSLGATSSMQSKYTARAAAYNQPQQDVSMAAHVHSYSGLASSKFGLFPFAAHELLDKQTSKSVSKILCKNCGK